MGKKREVFLKKSYLVENMPGTNISMFSRVIKKKPFVMYKSGHCDLVATNLINPECVDILHGSILKCKDQLFSLDLVKEHNAA